MFLVAATLLLILALVAVLYWYSNQRGEQFWATQTALAQADQSAGQTQSARPTVDLTQLPMEWAATQAALQVAAPTERALAETAWAEQLETARAQTATAAPGVTASVAAQLTASQATGRAATATLGALATDYALEANYQEGVRMMENGYWFQARDLLEDVLAGDADYKDAKERLATVEAEIERTAGVTETPRPSNYHWVQRSPLSDPGARLHYGLAYDAMRGVTVLFGGSSGGALLGDTWEWDGKRWWQLDPGAAPPPRQGAVLVFDETRLVTVMFGGRGAEGLLGDTWVYDGNWSSQVFAEGESPGARAFACAAYDAGHNQLVMFGGVDSAGQTAETWTFDGELWALREATPAPTARSGCAMAYDPGSKTVLLFGGRQGGAPLNDTWEWDGQSWRLVEAAGGPPARAFHGMSYHTRLGGVLFVGGEADGCATYNDAWLWDEGSWRRLESGNPGPRAAIGLAYNSSANSVLLFGGHTTAAGICAEDGETWELVLR